MLKRTFILLLCHIITVIGYAQSRIDYEYWLDNDYNHKVTCSSINGEIFESILLSDLNPGVHSFNLRPRNSEGEWGTLYSSLFYLPEENDKPADNIVGYSYTFNSWSKYESVNETSSLELANTFIDIPDVKYFANVEDGTFVCDLEKETMTMNRNSDVNFTIKFVDNLGHWSAPKCTSFSLSDVITHSPVLLENQKTVLFDKCPYGDFIAAKIVVDKRGTYYLKSSQECNLSIFKDGKSYIKKVNSSNVVSGYRIGLDPGVYYVVIYNTLKNDKNISDKIQLRFYDTDNFVPNPKIEYKDGVVSIDCDKSDASIFYTLDGKEPTKNSLKYNGSFPVDSNTVIQAIATYDGMGDSYTSTYRIDCFTADAPSVLFADSKVFFFSETDDVEYYYTLDGSKPTLSSLKYEEPFVLDKSCTIKVFAHRNGWNPSVITTYVHDSENVKCVKPEILVEGTTLTMYNISKNAKLYYTTDGSVPSKDSQCYTEPITLSHNGLYRIVAVQDGYKDSEVVELCVDWFQVAPPSFTFNQSMLTISSTTPDAVIYYVVSDEDEPTRESTIYSEPIELKGNTMVKAFAVADNFNDSEVKVYNPDNFKVETPVVYIKDKKIFIECYTEGTKIYYTLDGSNPTLNSLVYTEPLAVSYNCTVKAIGIKDKYDDSDVIEYSYDRSSVYCESPSFTEEDYILSLSCETEGAIIYYSIDGTTPTTNSLVYSEPIRLTHNMTVKAFTSKDDMIPSPVLTYNVVSFRVDKPIIALKDSVVTITCATEGATIYYVVGEGVEVSSLSEEYIAPFEIHDNTTIYTVAVKDGLTDSYIEAFTPSYFVCGNVDINFDGMQVSLGTDTKGDAYILYTLDGTEPSDSNKASIKYAGEPFIPDSLCTVKAVACKSGFINSSIGEKDISYLYSLSDGNAIVQTNTGGCLEKCINLCNGNLQVKSLTIKGEIDSSDLTVINGFKSLCDLNLQETNVKNNKIPDDAFKGMQLRYVAFPKNLKSYGKNIFEGNNVLAAIEWNCPIMFEKVILGNCENPNLLFFTNDKSNVPSFVENVVVNGLAEKVILKDSNGNNNFYSPYDFNAQYISYTHCYTQETPIGGSQGWEGLSLPFNVSSIRHFKNGEIYPFGMSNTNGNFWLCRYNENNGFVKVGKEEYYINAYVPYIISMPNNENYLDEYIQSGEISFIGEGEIKKTPELNVTTTGLYPTMERIEKTTGVAALNIGVPYDNYAEGSVFVHGLRDIKPFEVFFNTSAHLAPIRGLLTDVDNMIALKDRIEIWEDHSVLVVSSPVKTKLNVYNVSGQLVRSCDIVEGVNYIECLPPAIYIVNGQKFFIK